MTTENLETFYTADRDEWRAWLEKNFETSKGVWFVYPNKNSDEEGVPYNDAVEEALCFGWIDSTQKTLDDTHRMQRFTPRRKNSPYSQLNIERLKEMDRLNKIHPKIRPSVVDLIEAEFEFPEDIIEELKTVWKNYQSFSEPYKRIRVAYIDAARNRPDEFQKRLNHFIDKTRKGVLIKGYFGTAKYYS